MTNEEIYASRLSEHFTFREMTTTNVRSLQTVNMQEAVPYHGELTKVCESLLEPPRQHFNVPVIVNSGFRSDQLNEVIGGSPRSQHRLGEAADFRVVGVELAEVFDWIVWESPVLFGQIILEGYAANKPTWIHISLGEPYREKKKCGQVMTWSRDDGYRLIALKDQWGVRAVQ